jgi:hypothetical protein
VNECLNIAFAQLHMNRALTETKCEWMSWRPIFAELLFTRTHSWQSSEPTCCTSSTYSVANADFQCSHTWSSLLLLSWLLSWLII